MDTMNDVTQTVLKANERFFGSAMRMGEMAMDFQGKLASQQLKAFEQLVQAGNKQMELVKDIRNPVEFYSRSSEVAGDLGQALATTMREMLELQAELGGKLVAAVSEEVAATLRPLETRPKA